MQESTSNAAGEGYFLGFTIAEIGRGERDPGDRP